MSKNRYFPCDVIPHEVWVMEEGTHFDSRHVHKSDQMTHNQPVSQQSNSQSQSFQCNYCILIFKSKYFLHEHVSKVHGFDVDTSQCEDDLTPPKTATAPTIKSLYEYSGDLFSCRHCVFTASRWSVIFKHENMFHKDKDERAMKPQKTQSMATLKKVTYTPSHAQHKQEQIAKMNSSTSKTNSSSSLMKDLETHISSSGNFSVSPSQSTLKLKSPGQETDVQVVTESEPMNTHNCLLCSFTSSSVMDLRNHQQQKHVYLYNMRANLGPMTVQSPETFGMALASSSKIGKRTHDDIIASLYPAMKKRKEDPSSLESIVIKTKLSGASSFTFEVSEDEDEEEECAFGDETVDFADIADGESTDGSDFCCKHCNFTHKSARGVGTHYQRMHPYIRCSFQYIRDPNDKSATYRCLECPIEFATVNDLKKHYRDYHPQAPDVFILRSHELTLVFKCFICTYTTTTSRFLKVHFKEEHPTKKINNPLMYCRYAVNNPQEKNSQSQTSTAISSPRKARIMSPKAAQAPCNETSNTPPKASPISKRSDDDIYHCKHCAFSNKSVAVTLDHYQKQHPESGVTIDQIKPASLSTSTTKKSKKLHVPPQKMVSEPSDFQRVKSPNSSLDNSDHPPEEPGQIFICHVCNYSLSTVKGIITHQRRAHGGLRVTASQIRAYTAEVQNNAKKSPLLATVSTNETPSSQLLTTGSTKETPSSSPEDHRAIGGLFFCQLCNYGHPTTRGILNHQRKRHTNLKGTADQVQKYTAMLCGKNQTSFALPFPLIQDETKTKMFCQWCNFSHSEIRRILNHQYKTHIGMERSVMQIRKYSARVYKHASKSQLINTDSLSSSFSSAGVTDRKQLFSCQRCDYSNSTVRGVLNHQKIKHRDLKASANQVVRHTVGIRSKKDMKKNNLSENKPCATASPIESKKSGELGSLQCCKCPYRTSHLYLLRRHLIKNHQTTVGISELVRSAYRKGQLEQGYHCQWCTYFHAEAQSVYQHGQECHAGYACISLEHITLRLYAGPKRSRAKQQGPRSESNAKHEPTPPFSKDIKTAPSQKSVKKAAKVFPCRACPFKSSSFPGIQSHYRAVHPWSVKDDGSVLDVISSRQPSENRQNLEGDVHNKILSYDRREQPVDGSGKLAESISSHEASTSSGMFECPICSQVYNTYHGLKTHCGKKHPEYKHPEYKPQSSLVTEYKPETNEELSVYSVFKCKLCPYVNTRGHGVLTHCQMKHPSFKAKAEKLEKKMVSFSNMKCMRGNGLKGYLCKLCLVAHTSLFMLKVHNKKTHNRAVSTKLKTVKQTNVIKQLISKYWNNQGQQLPRLAISQAAILKAKRRRKCHRCNFVCSRMKVLASHINTCHKSSSEYTYTCSLCTYSSVVPVYLAAHYRRMHGQAAYTKYYIPQQKYINQQKQKSEACSSVSPELQPSLRNENPDVDGRKCPLCPHLSSSENDMITHFISSHHGVGHTKTQQSSEPGVNIMWDSATKNMKRNPDKGKHVSRLLEAPSEKGPFKCKKCIMLYFDSPLLLSIHYTEFHRCDFKQDFTIPSKTIGKVKFYNCGYCNIRIKGNQELCSHLNHHAVFRNSTKAVFVEPQPKANSVKPGNEELPKSSTFKTTEMAGLEKHLDEDTGFPCGQCGRVFMSLKGVRSHERSHAALAAFKRRAPQPKHIFEEHYSYRPGTTKPFCCGLCVYRTTLMILLKSHLLKKHQAEYPDKDLDIPTTSSKDLDNNLGANEVPSPQEDVMTELPNEQVLKQKRGYLEPTDVQQQLNRYKQMALSKAPAPAPLQAAVPFQDGLFHCEFCDFTTGHMSSVRRHYLSRHNGKRLLRCKDCSYFTCFRKKFVVHMEAGGSRCLAEAPKDLRCPLCLYHTRNKNNMIDHIDLHREERVAPIEVRRPKLSRYLEGIVFRCHKCTFSSGCDENLRLHILKHDDIKPYKCRLCYFDCIQLSELEAHLCEKHQVMRNHELVGQVNLVQLETRNGKANVGKEGKCNMESRNKKEEDQAINYEHDKQGQEREENKAEQNYKQNIAQNSGEQTKDRMANHDKMEQNDELSQKQGEHIMEIKAEQDNGAENTLEIHEMQVQKGQKVTGPNNRYHEKHEAMDIVILNCESLEMQGQGLEVEFNPEAKNHYNDEKHFHKETRGIVSRDRLIGQKQGFTDENNGGQNEKYNERHREENTKSLEEPSVDCREDPVHKERSKEQQMDKYGDMPVLENVYHRKETYSTLNEKEEQTEEMDKPEKTDKCNKIQEEGCEEKKVHKEHDETNGNPEYLQEERTETDIASTPQDGCTSARKNPLICNEKPFSCKLCGRTLTNTIELQRHLMRHGI